MRWLDWFGMSSRRAGRIVLLTGIPRSGTTLACRLLNRLPDVVALVEPLWNTGILDTTDRERAARRIERWARTQWRSTRATGRGPTGTVAGAATDNLFADAAGGDGVRPSVVEIRDLPVGKPLSPDYLLAIKHPATFTALIEDLSPRFEIHAQIRNPLAVLASWSSADIALRKGRIPPAEQFDLHLFRRLARTDDVLGRQVRVLEWFFETYRRCVPTERIVRYGEVVATGGRALAQIAPAAADLTEPLENRNVNPLYDAEFVQRAAERLLRTSGAIWDFYTRASVENLASATAVAAARGA